MTANYILLEKIVVGAAGASSVVFSNIPQSAYTDLVLKMSVKSNQTNVGYTAIQFNSSTTNYQQKFLGGSGTSTLASYAGVSNLLYALSGSTSTNSQWDNTEVYIPNYTSSNFKTVSIDNVVETNSTSDGFITLMSGQLANTAAITSITLSALDQGTSFNRVFQQYSSFSLYGVAKLGDTPTIAPYATGGDIIETDGTYWYHAFLSSGTFTPAKTFSADVLVVAGGGSGGADVSGGGGAGGVIAFASQSLANGTAYTATIGAGGAGLATKRQEGNSGSNSQFGSLTAAVGGGRGTATLNADGGSGGGTRVSGGAATSGQGNAGGGGSNSAI